MAATCRENEPRIVGSRKHPGALSLKPEQLLNHIVFVKDQFNEWGLREIQEAAEVVVLDEEAQFVVDRNEDVLVAVGKENFRLKTST